MSESSDNRSSETAEPAGRSTPAAGQARPAAENNEPVRVPSSGSRDVVEPASAKAPRADWASREVPDGTCTAKDEAGSGEVDGQSDAQLVAAALRDRAAFDALYRRYLPPVYRYALAELANVAEAEDACEATFVAALVSLPRYREQGRFAAWLFTIARREIAARRRRAAREPLIEAHHGGGTVASNEERLLLEQVLQRLTPDRRQAIALRFYAGLQVSEVARLMGRGESAVKMLLHRGLAHLRELLAEDNDG